MTELKILICGAGIAGNALAYWLAQQRHHVTVIERHPDLRSTGLQIDIRGHGIEVLKRMGLEAALRSMSVKEQGLEFVNSSGKVIAYFPANTTGTGLQSFTTDYEIMRGDLIRLLYDRTKDRVRFTFGTTVDSFEQLDDSVEVLFSSGDKGRYDLVIGADGQWSRTRRQMIGPEAKDPVNFLGVYAGYFTFPRPINKGEAYNGTGYIAPGKRLLFTRRHSTNRVQAYLVGLNDSERLMAARKDGGVEDEKAIFSELFRSAGWRSEELIEEMQNSPDFYCEHMGVVRLDTWSKGRVGLLGDAAYCPTATTGMGTTSSLVGAYVLAGEIQRHCSRNATSKEIVPEALHAYEERFRPFMKTVQDGIEKDKTYWHKMPSGPILLMVLNIFLAIASFFRLDVLAKNIMKEDTGNWKLPDYEAMDLRKKKD
ncbi:putative 2-polyprenyl-6-methoxyphenol hydroxylase [Fusarium globosum]|uniref:Putative 2-polyprenyl-6-methoxyphenol hydroxylase n=1 Tax=Fusarium globosum TaxID=78864 RepID=A0A8H5XPF6_9HYPO|nr:putative 2-polyprenyl-6-methoxyphenol hydroxylase [Fusarium globosum]